MQTRIRAAKKVCRSCGNKKLLSEFRRDCRQKDGLQSHCKECRTRWDKRYREKTAEANKSKRSVYSMKDKAMMAVRRLTRKVLGKPKRCAVACCNRRTKVQWHHMTKDHLTVIGLCPTHHMLIHKP